MVYLFPRYKQSRMQKRRTHVADGGLKQMLAMYGKALGKVLLESGLGMKTLMMAS